MSRQRAERVIGDRPFFVFLVGQSLSALGDAITMTIMPLLVLSLTSSGTALGVLGAFKAAPSFVLALPAGAFADRTDARRLMARVDTWRTVLLLSVPVALSVRSIPGTWALGAIFPWIGVCEALFLAALPAALTGLVGRERFAAANAYMQAGLAIATMVGPAIAPLVARAAGLRWSLLVDAATFAASAATLWSLRAPLDVRLATEHVEPSTARDVREGLRFAARHGTLRPLLAFWTLIRFLDAPLVSICAFFVEVDHALPASTLPQLFSAYAAGAVLGAVVGTRLPLGRLGAALLGGVALMAIGGGVLSAARAPAPALAAAVFAGVGRSLALMTFSAIRVRVTPDAFTGRVGSIMRLLATGATPLSLIVAGALLDRVGGARTLLATSATVVVVGAVFACSRAIRSGGAGDDAAEPAVSPAMLNRC